MKSAIALGFFAVMFLPALLFVSVPQSALAAGIVPPECQGEGRTVAANCDVCAAVTLIENLIDLFIEIMLIVGTIVVVVAGFRLVTSGGDVAAKEGAKKMLVNAIIGLLLVLAAWLIVDTIIRAIFGGEQDVGDFGPWNNFSQEVCGIGAAAGDGGN